MVTGGSLADTVDAEPVQALVVEVIGAPEGTVVRFESSGSIGRVKVGSLADPGFGVLAVAPVKPNGTAAVRIKLGEMVGTGRVRVVVPELGLEDSVPYTIRAGAAFAMRALPKDTAVALGGSFTARSAVVDRYGNSRTDPVALASLDPEVAVAGATISGSAAGRGRVEVSSGPARDTMFVSVVPDGCWRRRWPARSSSSEPTGSSRGASP